MTTESLPLARSWRVRIGYRWRAEATCGEHGRKTTRFKGVNVDGTWRFECRPDLESLAHDFDARPRPGAELDV